MSQPTTSTSDHDRLHAYAEAFFQRSGRTEWATIRQAARSLGWRQERVYDAIEGDPHDRMFVSSYFSCAEPSLGDYFIETTEEGGITS